MFLFKKASKALYLSFYVQFDLFRVRLTFANLLFNLFCGDLPDLFWHDAFKANAVDFDCAAVRGWIVSASVLLAGSWLLGSHVV